MPAEEEGLALLAPLLLSSRGTARRLYLAQWQLLAASTRHRRRRQRVRSAASAAAQSPPPAPGATGDAGGGMAIATGGEPGEMHLAKLPSLQRAVAPVEVEGSCLHFALPAAAPGRRGAKSAASLSMFLRQPRISKLTDAFGSNLTSSFRPEAMIT